MSFPRAEHVRKSGLLLSATLVFAVVILNGFAFPTEAADAGANGELTLVPVAYHPYPDDADPLGVPFYYADRDAWDYFQVYYSRLDPEREGFAFPSVVVDGLRLISGVPGGEYETTLAAYREALQERRGLETPVTLIVNHTDRDGFVRIGAKIEPKGDIRGELLSLHWALTEDDVYYRPPPALSNGVFIHRFTVRDVAQLPWAQVDLGNLSRRAVEFDVAVDPEWNLDNVYIAVWLQNEVETSSRFAEGEVVQAALHSLQAAEPTVQTGRAVLFEMYTATWCAACLYGDNALSTLANDEGLVSSLFQMPRWRYIPNPQPLALGLGVAAGGLVAIAVLWTPPRTWTLALGRWIDVVRRVR